MTKRSTLPIWQQSGNIARFDGHRERARSGKAFGVAVSYLGTTTVSSQPTTMFTLAPEAELVTRSQAFLHKLIEVGWAGSS